MLLSKNKYQQGIAALEAAGFLAVVAVLGLGLFAVAEAVLTRYAVDSVIEATLSESASLQKNGRILKQHITGNGQMQYVYDLDAVSELVNQTSSRLDQLRLNRSFLKNLSFNYEISVYQLSIDENNGKVLGFVGSDIKKSNGSLAVPSVVYSKHSISKTYADVLQSISNGVSLYAEPTGMVIYEQNSKKYLPSVPILTACLYVADPMVNSTLILDSVFPAGIIANCQAVKVRDFI